MTLASTAHYTNRVFDRQADFHRARTARHRSAVMEIEVSKYMSLTDFRLRRQMP
jgi:hypothetical protein